MPDWINTLRFRISQFQASNSDRERAPLEPSPIRPELLREIQQRFPMPKFFIFGYPRSGTTLLMRLIRLHPEIHCNRQAHFFTYPRAAAQALSDQEIRAWLERGNNRWTAGKGLETAPLRLVADFIMESEARQLGKRIVGDKSPTVIGGLAVRRMHAIYPDARCVYLIRDGRDVAVSRLIQRFIDQPQHMTRADRGIKEDFARNPDPYLNKEKSIFSETFLQDEARSWSRNLDEITQQGSDLLQDSFTCLRYEDLLADPSQELASIWSFLGVDPEFPEAEARIAEKMAYNPGADDQSRKESDMVSQLKRGTSGGWKDLFNARDQAVFSSIAGNTLKAWGYTEAKST
jgi:Sulfotransferase family